MRRVWLIASIAQTFGLRPTIVAHDLDNDPEDLAVECLWAIRFGEAYFAYQRNDPNILKGWEGSRMMDLVKGEDFRRAQEELLDY